MSKMKVKVAKLTTDIYSTKIVYEKNGKLYVRSGKDGFKIGQPVQSSIQSLKLWGFKEVHNAPIFRDGEEMFQNINKFELKQDGSAVYSD